MSRRIRALSALVVGLVLAVTAAAPVQAAPGPDSRRHCWGFWAILTGTGDGAGGHRVNWVALKPNSDTTEYKTGKWEGAEIQNGKWGYSSDYQGPCTPPAHSQFELNYNDGIISDKWQVETIILYIMPHKGADHWTRKYMWRGPRWIGNGPAHFTPECFNDCK